MEQKRSRSLAVFGVVVAACLFYALSNGIRSNYGLIRGALSESSGVGYGSISLILAVAQLTFGIMQPVFGVAALKKGNAFVLGCGAALTALGLLVTPLCRSAWTLMAAFGLLMPAGFGALSFGVIMGAVTPLLGEERAAAASGLVSASGGLGSIILAPILRTALDLGGLWGAVLSLSIPTLCQIPVALWLSRFKADAQPHAEEKRDSLRALLPAALKNRSYLFLMAAFFTCGFHMSIIETHLYTHFLTYGFSEHAVTYAFSLYGIMAMLGSVVSGFLGSRFPMQKVLGLLYGSRTVWIIGFLLLPKTIVTVYAFAALLGFTGNATVPPTSGLVGKLFGPARLGTLFGLAFVAHQIGSFFSAWLGGICLTATGGYTLIWCASAVLSLVAAVVSFCVKSEAVHV